MSVWQVSTRQYYDKGAERQAYHVRRQRRLQSRKFLKRDTPAAQKLEVAFDYARRRVRPVVPFQHFGWMIP